MVTANLIQQALSEDQTLACAGKLFDQASAPE
jgi:hypothetical protein